MPKAKGGPDAEFPRAEFEQRYRRAWKLMEKHGLAGFLVTSQPNHRYLTGHRTQFWVSTARPMYTILAHGRRPVCVVTEIEAGGLSATSYVDDIRTFSGFSAESLPVLTGALRELGFEGQRVGVDFGEEMRLGIPLTALRKLEALLPRVAFVDGAPALWELRLIKSDAEVDYIRRACLAAHAGIRKGWRWVRAGMTAKALHRKMTVAMVEAGADKVNWFPLVAGEENNDKYTLEPSERRFRAGDVAWCDIGVTVNGYWSDFSRLVAVGKASQGQKDDYKSVWEATQACIDAIRPGSPIGDLVKPRDAIFKRIGYVQTTTRPGRIGHGSGLDITEPPSIVETDPTIIEEGMVLHIEPKIVRPHGIFQLEELAVVTRSGHKMITDTAPRNLPVAAGG